MHKPGISTLSNFIEGYKLINNELVNQESIAILDKLPNFLEGYFHIKEKIINENKNTAPEYNIFNIARFETLETKLHSPIIANLLDPSGSHSQGDLLLKNFFKIIPALNLSILDTWDLRYLKISNEIGTGFYGNIDIMLKYTNLSNPYLIIIENKIYAGDQELQIERYYNYARKSLLLDDSQIKILYLSLIDSQPSEYSISEEERNRLTGIDVLQNISYANHIIPWLENVIAEIKAPIVTFTILQYLKTIKTLVQ